MFFSMCVGHPNDTGVEIRIPVDVLFSGSPDINVEVHKKVPDASRTRDFNSLILIYEVQSVLEHGCL